MTIEACPVRCDTGSSKLCLSCPRDLRHKIVVGFRILEECRDPSLRFGISDRSYLRIPCRAAAMLSRLEFFTMYIISSAWRMISCELLASSG